MRIKHLQHCFKTFGTRGFNMLQNLEKKMTNRGARIVEEAHCQGGCAAGGVRVVSCAKEVVLPEEC